MERRTTTHIEIHSMEIVLSCPSHKRSSGHSFPLEQNMTANQKIKSTTTTKIHQKYYSAHESGASGKKKKKKKTPKPPREKPINFIHSQPHGAATETHQIVTQLLIIDLSHKKKQLIIYLSLLDAPLPPSPSHPLFLIRFDVVCGWVKIHTMKTFALCVR